MSHVHVIMIIVHYSVYRYTVHQVIPCEREIWKGLGGWGERARERGRREDILTAAAIIEPK